MRSTIATIAAIALIANVNAGIVSGACQNLTNVPYNNVTMGKPIQHFLLGMDKTVYSYLGLAQALAPKGAFPNLTCFNLGNFGYPQTVYQSEFVNQTSVLALKELYFDAATGTQVAYDCIDSSKAAALIAYANKTLGININATTVATFNKLLKGAHFDVTFILSNQTSINATTTAAMVKGVQKDLPKFAMTSIHMFNTTGCKA